MCGGGTYSIVKRRNFIENLLLPGPKAFVTIRSEIPSYRLWCLGLESGVRELVCSSWLSGGGRWVSGGGEPQLAKLSFGGGLEVPFCRSVNMGGLGVRRARGGGRVNLRNVSPSFTSHAR